MGGQPWPELELHGQPWGRSPEREERGKGKGEGQGQGGLHGGEEEGREGRHEQELEEGTRS
jgi:hypothetical protein